MALFDQPIGYADPEPAGDVVVAGAGGTHLFVDAGGVWLHLRVCLSCGHVGCCDNSPGRHATAHNHESGHPLIHSLESGEDWSWCYVEEVAMIIPEIQGETRIPPSPMLTR